MARENPRPSFSIVRFLSRVIQIVYMTIVTICMLLFYQKAQDESKKSQKAHEELLRLKRKKAKESGGSADDQNCSVCLTNPLEMLLKPCGHICICHQCLAQLLNHSYSQPSSSQPKCPICREDVINSERVYLS